MTTYVVLEKVTEKFIGHHVTNLCEINSKVSFKPYFLLLLLEKEFILILKLQKKVISLLERLIGKTYIFRIKTTNSTSSKDRELQCYQIFLFEYTSPKPRNCKSITKKNTYVTTQDK